MSLVLTKLNGVFGLRAALFSTHFGARRVIRLAGVLRGPLVEAGDVRVRRDLLAVLDVALHGPVGQPQRAGGVRVRLRAIDGEHGLPDLRIRGGLDGGDLVVEALRDGLRVRLE